jgi:hypothetical protein
MGDISIRGKSKILFDPLKERPKERPVKPIYRERSKKKEKIGVLREQETLLKPKKKRRDLTPKPTREKKKLYE